MRSHVSPIIDKPNRICGGEKSTADTEMNDVASHRRPDGDFIVFFFIRGTLLGIGRLTR
jgi:hypothetical protein